MGSLVQAGLYIGARGRRYRVRVLSGGGPRCGSHVRQVKAYSRNSGGSMVLCVVVRCHVQVRGV